MLYRLTLNCALSHQTLCTFSQQSGFEKKKESEGLISWVVKWSGLAGLKGGEALCNCQQDGSKEVLVQTRSLLSL